MQIYIDICLCSKNEKLYKVRYNSTMIKYITVEAVNKDKWTYLYNQLTGGMEVVLIESGNERRCYKNGVLHRENGPAVECMNNETLISEWWINGKFEGKTIGRLTKMRKMDMMEWEMEWVLNGVKEVPL